MKIEKINENQIRCTLTKEDLDSHQIRISELAYGTEKAKRLFRDMMQQAQIQFGFEADNIPLMIEAIPVNAESIILIITKVEDPEELEDPVDLFTSLPVSFAMVIRPTEPSLARPLLLWKFLTALSVLSPKYPVTLEDDKYPYLLSRFWTCLTLSP